MATQKPTNMQPVCGVPGCKNGCQMSSIHGYDATWLKTCRRHTYQDLPEEQAKLKHFGLLPMTVK